MLIAFDAALLISQTATPDTAGGSSGVGDWTAWLPIVISTFALFVSGLTAYTNWRTHRAKKPVVDIAVDGLPPYADAVQLTTICLKNVGSAATVRGPEIEVECSWVPGLVQRLRLPHDNYCLDPNEQMSWKVRLDDSLPSHSKVVVRVYDGTRYAHRDSWERHIELTPSVPAISNSDAGSTTLPNTDSAADAAKA